MSYTNFIKAMELAPKCKFYTTAGGKSEEEIRKSEQILNIKFSNQCREFYENMDTYHSMAAKFLELTQMMILEYWKEILLLMR